MKNSLGVIVLGGHVLGYGIINIYAKYDIPSVVIDSEPFRITRYSRYCKAFYSCSGDKIVELLLSFGRQGKYNGWLIIPTDDMYLSLVSRNKTELNEYFVVTVDDWDVIEKFYNKRFTYPLAENAGVPIPKTGYPGGENDLKEISRMTGFPCIVKPAIGYDFLKEFNTKVFKCNSESELRSNYRKALKVLDPGNVLVQEVIPGSSENQYSACLFFDIDKTYNSLTARRTRQNPPDFGTGTSYAETVNIPELSGYAEKILSKAGFRGICEVEFKYDARDGKYKFLEVNARIWRWHSIAEGASVPFLLSMYKYFTTGEPVVSKDFIDCAWRDEVRDIPAIYKMKRKNEYIKSEKKKTIHAVLDRRDLKPFIMQILSIPYFKIRGDGKKQTGYH